MLLPHILTDPDQSGEGIKKLFPYLEACDTRVAMYVFKRFSFSLDRISFLFVRSFVAKFMREQIKHSDPSSYFDTLRNMHNAAVGDGDEALLDNVYLHTRHLLLLQAQ